MKDWPWQKKLVKALEALTAVGGILLAIFTDVPPGWWVAITSGAMLLEEWIVSNFPMGT